MAELAAVASIVQIADIGFRLSIKLFSFAESVASADQAIISTSKDVSLTSSVLKEVGEVLKKDQSFGTYSATAIQTAAAIVTECSEVFQAMEKVLLEKVPNINANRKEKGLRTTMTLERFKWSYWQPKLQLLRGNLDRLRSTLLVMLNVITYQRLLSTASADVHTSQIALIRDLIESKEKQTEKYERLKRSLSDSENPSLRPSHISNGFMASTNAHYKPSQEVPPQDGEALREHRSLADFGQQKETLLGYAPDLMNLFHRLIMEVDTSAYRIGLLSRYRIRTHIYKARFCELDQLKYLYGSDALEGICKGPDPSLFDLSTTSGCNTHSTADRKRPREPDQSPNDTRNPRRDTRRHAQHLSSAHLPSTNSRESSSPGNAMQPDMGINLEYSANCSQVRSSRNRIHSLNFVGTASVPTRESRKKRGRPSKAEQELRAAEAAARGESYPPLKKTRTPRLPVDQGSFMTNESENLDASMSSLAHGLPSVIHSPGEIFHKKRGRPSKAEDPNQFRAYSMSQIPARSYAQYLSRHPDNTPPPSPSLPWENEDQKDPTQKMFEEMMALWTPVSPVPKT